MTRAGIYVRISRDREGTELGVGRQETDCRRLAEARGWTVGDVYADNDTSATTGRARPAYRRMLADIDSGRLDAVVAYSSSRFYRRARDLEELIGLTEQKHVEIATVASGRIDLSTADGRMIARMLAAADQAEAERIGERSSRAKADLKRQGRWLGGGARAYGYERVKDDGGKVREHRIVEAEAAVLREVGSRALAGESLSKLAAELNRREVPTSSGGRWQPSRLRALVTSPFHSGRFPDGSPGDWPAVFTEDEATLLRARFPHTSAGVGRGHGPRVVRSYALSGLAVCSECGRNLLGSGGAYKCQIRNGGCGKVGIRSWLLDRHVDELLWQSREVSETEGVVPPPADVDTEALVRAVQAAEARATELHEAYAAGEVTLDDFKAMREAVARRQEEAEARLREATPIEVPFATFTHLADMNDPAWAAVVDLRERWQQRELTAEEVADLNDVFRRWIEKVTVAPALRRGRLPSGQDDTPRRVSIEWR